MPRLEAYTSVRQSAGEVQIRFVDPPVWVEGDLESALLAVAGKWIAADPLQRDGLVAARDALLATGWFDGVQQVRRVDPRLVEIDAVFVRPFAVIRDDAGGREYLVDPRGRLLPKSFPAGGASGFTRIVGVRFAPPQQRGQVWPGADVTAALKILHLIHDRPWRTQVAEIDVAALSRSATIRLRTARDCVILWGRPPGEESGSEVPALRKLSYLDYHYEQYGHIDRGFLRELDITGDVVVGR